MSDNLYVLEHDVISKHSVAWHLYNFYSFKRVIIKTDGSILADRTNGRAYIHRVRKNGPP